MTALIPTSSICHVLQLPPTEKDDRLNLNVRTGSASVLYHSFVFTYGGLTIGLELDDSVSVDHIVTTFLLRVGSKSRRMRKYLSGELFYLDLILKVWKRVDIAADAPRPKPRLFHELARGDGRIYVFGGLALPDDADDAVHPPRLEPLNDLWEFNITTSTWRQLHDGAGWQDDANVPMPRFCHKMAIIESLPFANKKDHFGLMIAGGLDSSSQPTYSNVVFDLVDEKYVCPAHPVVFLATTGDPAKDEDKELTHFQASKDHQINVNYLNSIIVNFQEEVEHYHAHGSGHGQNPKVTQNKSIVEEESVIIYAPTKQAPEDATISPLLSFRMAKKFGRGKVLSSLRKKGEKQETPALSKVMRHTIPLNLRYPTGGLFGQNLVITGFLPNDYDISIFIFNKPTGKWSRLNIYCNHDYGSHRFWGGFAWTSHHRVVLIGNYVTSRTTSSIRYFSSMITVSLPVTNILASSEIAGSHFHGADGKVYVMTQNSSADEIISTSSSFTDESSVQLPTGDSPESPLRPGEFPGLPVPNEGAAAQHAVSFNDYVHYAAPKVNFTKVRSVFPPAAITLGRNAFDRYGDLISDFELISTNGDRLPVSMKILQERWGLYFVNILSRAYVQAIDKFESDQHENKSRLRSSKSSTGSGASKLSKTSSSLTAETNEGSVDEFDSKMHFQMSLPRPSNKEAPQFRLPFQDGSSNNSVIETLPPPLPSIDPHKQEMERKDSTASVTSGTAQLTPYLQDIPPQLPLPSEPIPSVPSSPVSYRSSSRKNSADPSSPRASIIHTLTALRNIPPSGSPFTSPRGSISLGNENLQLINAINKLDSPQSGDSNAEMSETHSTSSAEAEKNSVNRLDANLSSASLGVKTSSIPSTNFSSNSLSSIGKEPESTDGHTLLNFTTIDPSTFKMEPSLIPRKLYVPFSTGTLKAFCEYLYTGQVGNKWALKPCAIDCMVIARYYKVHLLYDLLCEVFYGILGRKEALVVKEGKKLKKEIALLSQLMNIPTDKMFKCPLDEYEGFMDTVDDGYLDIALLRKSSSLHQASLSSSGSHKVKFLSKLAMEKLEPEKQETEYFQRKANDDEPRSPKSKNDDDDLRSVGIDTVESDEEEEDEDDSDGFRLSVSLHYLDFQDRKNPFGPRSRSVFDRSLYDSITSHFDDDYDDEQEKLADVTIEQLVSPDSPEPSSYIIDLIHEAATLCTDVKLMLRSMNLRHMLRALKETRQECEKLNTIHQVSLKSQSPPVGNTDRAEQLESVQPIVPPPQPVSRPSGPSSQRSYGDVLIASAVAPKLEPTNSLTSINTARSQKSENMTRTTSALKFTPFKTLKSELHDSNKELDRKIAQMIKKDEKIMQRKDKEEKIMKHKLEREKRKQTLDRGSRNDDYSDMMSITSKSTLRDDQLIMSTSTSKARILKRIGSKLKGRDDTTTNLVFRTRLSTSLTSSSSGKKSGSKSFFGLRKNK